MALSVRTPPLWVSYWFAFTTVIVCWDASYCFLRPRSMVGGDLSWIWWPYNAVPYGAIDLIYGFKALDAGDGFTNAQALLNLVEAMLNIEYLYLRHTSPRTLHLTSADIDRPRYHGHAPLVGFAASCMTAAKTSLYFLQEYYCGWCMVGHNTLGDLIQYYIIPNGIWVIMPTIICIILGRFIAQRLTSDTATEIAYLEWKASTSASTPISTSTKPSPAIHLSPAQLSKAIPTTTSRCTRSKTATAASGSKTFPTVQIGAALPLTFTPTDLPTLIIGTNRLAATRAFALLESGAEVIVLSSQDLDVAHEEIRYRVEKKELEFVQKDAPGDAWVDFLKEREIALVCITDTMIGPNRQRGWTSAQQISQACRSLHIPVNVSDHPSLSSFTFPAVHRFAGADGNPSHLQVAVSTNGLGCRLSGRIKREIITRLPTSVGAAVDNVGHLRLRAKSRRRSRSSSNGSGISEDDPDTPLNNPVSQLDTPSILSGAAKQLGEGVGGEDEQLRRMRWVYQMSEYYSYEALARMTENEMDRALATWDERPSSDKPSLPQHENQDQVVKHNNVDGKGRIFLIGSGPGHPGLLTLAAHHALRSATLILSDKLVPSEILGLIPATTELHIAKKFPGNNEGAQNELMLQALEGAKRGETVVRLKQGDPFVYGRGGEEVLYFREHGFEATVVPGVTSAIAGPEMVGIPVTQRGVSEGLVLVTGVGRAGKSVNLPGYVKPRTLLVLMGVARIGNIVSVLTNLEGAGRDGAAFPRHLPIAVVERASSPDQRVIVSTLENIEEAVKSVEERPPGMMVIGWSVLALEGKGRVDVLDNEGTKEEEISQEWLGEDRWRIREGLDDGWGEYFAGLGV